MPRRVACNYLIIGKRRLVNHVVELDNNKVIAYYPLEGEPAMTEWVGGTIEIIDGKAYHQPSSDKEKKVLLES